MGKGCVALYLATSYVLGQFVNISQIPTFTIKLGIKQAQNLYAKHICTCSNGFPVSLNFAEADLIWLTGELPKARLLASSWRAVCESMAFVKFKMCAKRLQWTLHQCAK